MKKLLEMSGALAGGPAFFGRRSISAAGLFCAFLAALANVQGAQVITGTQGEPQNRAVMSFDGMAALEQYTRATNEVRRDWRPPWPAGNRDQIPAALEAEGAEGFGVAEAAIVPPAMGSFLPELSPAPEISFQGLTGTFVPDSHGAVGPEHVMTVANNGVMISDRNGNVLSSVTLLSFWQTLRVTSVFSPKVAYDPMRQRWMMTALSDRFSQNSSVLIGVSQGSNPRGRWNLYRVDVDSANVSYADSPAIGFNKDWIVVTANMIPFSGIFSRTFTGVNIYAFSKENLYTNGVIRFTRFQENSGRGFAMTPAVVHDATHETMYLVETDSLLRNYLVASSQLRISTITGPVGSEVLTVGSAMVDPGAPFGSSDPLLIFSGSLPQFGGFLGVYGGDARVQNAVFRNGSLWCTHTAWLPADNPDHAGVHWYQVSPSGSVIQHGRLEDTNGLVSIAYPSIAVNRNNDALIGFSKFSTNIFPSAAYAFRSCDDPPGSFKSDFVYKVGETPFFQGFTNFFFFTNGWGSYSATVTDPVDDLDMWTLQEYSRLGFSLFGDWGTWWAKVNVDTACAQTVFALNSYTVREGAIPGLASIEVLNLGGAAGSIDFSTSDGTAIAGNDYIGRNGTLVFAPGQTSTNFSIVILDDPFTNGNRTVNLALSNPGGAINLGFLSNAVLVIEDDEAVIPPNVAGEFNFSAYFTVFGAYVATENETCGYSCADDFQRIYSPDRTAYGAIVTVVRTNGNTGRVLIDYETAPGGTAIPNVDYTPVSGTLVFDHLQQSTNFLVQIGSDFFPNGHKYVRLVLSNPRPVPEEEDIRPGFLRPTLGPGSESGVFVLEINHGLAIADTSGAITTNGVLNFERFNYRVDEYPGGPPGTNAWCSFGGISVRGGTEGQYRLVAVNIVAGPAAVSGTIRVRTSDPVAGLILLNPRYIAGSEQAESPDNGFEVWSNPFFTDPTLSRITNHMDYVSIFDPNTPTLGLGDGLVRPTDPLHQEDGGVILTFSDECRKSIVIAITNDSTVEFNEDIVVILDPRPGDLPIGFNAYTHVTIVADDQPAGALDREWNPSDVEKSDPPFSPSPGADGFVNALAVQPDGKTVLGGDFLHVNQWDRSKIARLNFDGTLDQTFDPDANDFVSSVVLYPTNDVLNAGKVLIAGAFSSVNGASRRGVARLNANGTLDGTFNPGNGVNVGGIVRSMALQPDGRILIAGEFFEVDDFPRNGFARLNPDGSLDTTFDIGAGANGNVWSVAFTPDLTGGFKVLVGGDFNSINGEFRSGIAQLNPDGSVDPNFVPGSGINGSAPVVYAVAVQTNGLILIAGSFEEFNAVARRNIARLNSDGSLDETFDPGFGSDDSIYTLILQPDGKPMIGGVFTKYNGTRRLGIARLRYNGTLDTSFLDTAYNQYAGIPNGLSWEPPNFLRAIALQPDGNVMIGGSFTTVGGNPSEDRRLRNTWTVFTRADKQVRMNIARLIGGITPGPGNAEFAQDLYVVGERDPTAFVRLRRTDGRLGTLRAESTNITATAIGTDTDPLNADFVSTNVFSTWSEHDGNAPRPRSAGGTGDIFFRIPILDDALREGDEQIDLRFLSPDGSVTLGGEYIPLGGALGRTTARLTISDNEVDPGIINFQQAVYQVNETNRTAVITVIRTNGSDGSVSVNYRLRPSATFPATPGSDYTNVAGTLTFGLGETVKTFSINLVNDTLVEFDEFVDLILTNASNGAKLPGGTPTSVAVSQLRIVDNDFSPGRVNFTVTAFTNAETDLFATITVNRNGGSANSASIQYQTFSTGTAAPGVDYETTQGTLSWAAGESGPKTFVIPIYKDDDIITESLGIRLLNPTVSGLPEGRLLGNFTNATLTLIDTDFPGSITFGQPQYQADENASLATINLVRQGGVSGPGSVTFSAVADSASAGIDFTPVTTNVTFAPGQIGAAVYVPLLDDIQGDGNKVVSLRLSNPSGVTLGVLPNSSLLLVDNESFNEPAGSDDTAFNLTTETDGPIYSMGLQTTNGIIDGRILIAGDFSQVNRVPRGGLARLMTNGILDASFDVGSGPNLPARAVAIQSDGKVIVGGSFTQFNGTNRGAIARLHVDGTLDSSFNPGSGADNPVYTIVIEPDNRVLIGGAFNRVDGVNRPMIARLGTNGIVDVAFGGISGPNNTVYAIALQADGKILIGGEFTAVAGVPRNRLARLNRDGSLDLSFDTSVGFDAPVRAILVQADGRIVVGGSFLSVNGVPRAYLARLETDGRVDLGFMNGVSGANGAVFTLAQQIDGKIVAGGDFTRFNDVTRGRITRINQDGSTDTTINFGTGANAFVTSLLIQPDRKIVLGGGFTEYDEQPRLRIARIHGGSIAGPGSLTFSRSEFKVGEAESEVLITVKRKGGTTGAVGVNFTTASGTAIEGVDYRGTNGFLLFPNGETVQGFRVTVFNNIVTNVDMFLNLILSGYTGGATAGPDPTARLVIVNDESAIEFTQDSFSGNENAVSGNGTLVVRRTYATNNFLTVSFATFDGGTATAGVDYVPTNGFITFLPGEVLRNINVRLINDTNIEVNETINVALTGANATSGSSVFLGRSTATLTIVEDDFGPGRFILDRSEYVVREDGVSAQVTVIRTNGHTGFVSVNYRTIDSSAIGGFDFVPTNTVLAFADGETRKTISIGILEDNLMEGAENFTVLLSSPTGNSTIGAPSSANVTIVDNDTNLIVSAGAFLVSESGPVNNVIDPGETVTVAFGLRNIGSSATSNLLATLQTTPNLAPQGASTQLYGVLLANGDPVFRNYTFTATGPVGFRLVATLALTDGIQSYGIVTYPFTLSGSATNTSCNSTRIAIPLMGAATPYPSIINVSNVGGQVTKVVATLNGFNHGWPRDVDVLLEGPNGQTIMLMSDAGGLGPIGSSVTLSFDDKVASAIPANAFGSGTYRPANYAGESTSDAFPAPAPQPVAGGFSPYTNTSFSVFLGTNPNGAWKLYVVDDEGGDSGAIENGWCLTIVTGDPVGAGTDLVLAGSAPGSVLVGADLAYMYWITNRGSATATAITFTSPVTPKTTFVSASAGIGSPSLMGTNLTHTIASLAPGASTWIQYVVRGNEGGKTVTNVATVQSAQTELTPGNNAVTITTFIQAPSLTVARAGQDVTLSWPAATQGFVLQQSDNITPPSWTDVTVQPSIVGNQKRVVVRADGTCRSYRLRKL